MSDDVPFTTCPYCSQRVEPNEPGARYGLKQVRFDSFRGTSYEDGMVGGSTMVARWSPSATSSATPQAPPPDCRCRTRPTGGHATYNPVRMKGQSLIERRPDTSSGPTQDQSLRDDFGAICTVTVAVLAFRLVSCHTLA